MSYLDRDSIKPNFINKSCDTVFFYYDLGDGLLSRPEAYANFHSRQAVVSIEIQDEQILFVQRGHEFRY